MSRPLALPTFIIVGAPKLGPSSASRSISFAEDNAALGRLLGRDLSMWT